MGLGKGRIHSPRLVPVDRYFDAYFAWKPSEGRGVASVRQPTRIAPPCRLQTHCPGQGIRGRLTKIRQAKLSFGKTSATVLDGCSRPSSRPKRCTWRTTHGICHGAVVGHRRPDERNFAQRRSGFVRSSPGSTRRQHSSSLSKPTSTIRPKNLPTWRAWARAVVISRTRWQPGPRRRREQRGYWAVTAATER